MGFIAYLVKRFFAIPAIRLFIHKLHYKNMRE